MNTTKVFMNNGNDIFDAGHDCSEEQIQAEIMRIQEEAELKKKEELLARRNEIRKLLQRHSVSMSSLQVQSDKETRHEENCRAIPEGNEDEDEGEDDNDEGNDNDNDNDNEDDPIETMAISLSELSMTSTVLDKSDSDSNSDTENGDQQTEPKRRRKVFHRVKRFVAFGRKSQSIRC